MFNCVARLGWLNRMTQFKEKAGKDRENASVGLYAYPVLMAADILAYRATHVPVGDDQKQHLELARDIAQKFNNDFAGEIRTAGFEDGTFFPLCEPVIAGPATRVMSLRDGTRKMSKSEPSDLSRINMTDDADTIAEDPARQDRPAPPAPRRGGAREAPEAENLVGIHAALAGKTKAEVLAEFGGAQFSTFKKSLAELTVSRLAPVNAEMNRLLADPTEIDRVLADGARKARAIAAPIVETVKDIVGFLRS